MERRTINAKILHNSFNGARRNASDHSRRRQQAKKAPSIGRNQLYSVTWQPFHFVQAVRTSEVLMELYRVYSLSPGFIDFQIQPNTKPEQLCHELISRLRRLVPGDYNIGFIVPDDDDATAKVKLIFYRNFDDHNGFYYGNLRTVAEQKDRDPIFYRFLCSVFSALMQQGLTEIAEGKGTLNYFRKELEFRFKEELAELLTDEERAEMTNNHNDVLHRHDSYTNEYLRFLKDFNRSCLSPRSLRAYARKHGLLKTYGEIVEHGLDLADNPSGTHLSDFLLGVSTDDYNVQVYPDRYILCGWDMESPVEKDYVEHLDCEAQEGSVSPAHAFHMEATWRCPVVDNTYLDKLRQFFIAVDNLE